MEAEKGSARMNETQEHKYPIINIAGILAGILIGGLAGTVTILLLAPQSGKRTRTQIQKKSLELRDRAAEMVDDSIRQLRADRNKISINGRKKSDDLTRRGQALVIEHNWSR